jgi:hypothetical protein
VCRPCYCHQCAVVGIGVDIVILAITVAIAVSNVPFLVDCCISPPAFAVSAVVFVTLLLPLMLPLLLLPPLLSLS